jgi:hypothetical protein
MLRGCVVGQSSRYGMRDIPVVGMMFQQGVFGHESDVRAEHFAERGEHGFGTLTDHRARVTAGAGQKRLRLGLVGAQRQTVVEFR